MVEPIEEQGLVPERASIYFKRRVFVVVSYSAGLVCLFAFDFVKTPAPLHYGFGIAAIALMGVGIVFNVRLQRALKKYRATGVIE